MAIPFQPGTPVNNPKQELPSTETSRQLFQWAVLREAWHRPPRQLPWKPFRLLLPYCVPLFLLTDPHTQGPAASKQTDKEGKLEEEFICFKGVADQKFCFGRCLIWDLSLDIYMEISGRWCK